MEHTRFLLLTRNTSVECSFLRIEREARKIAERTSYTPCVLLSFSSLIQTTNVVPKLNFENRVLISKLLMSIKTDGCGPFPHCLSSCPGHVLPERKRLCILCVPPKFHNLPSRGNIIKKKAPTSSLFVLKFKFDENVCNTLQQTVGFCFALCTNHLEIEYYVSACRCKKNKSAFQSLADPCSVCT